MIKDKVENAEMYYGLSQGLKEGLMWLKLTDLHSLTDGRYDLPNGLYANVQTYQTKEDAHYEAHKKYIDIQYMISGSEKFGFCNHSNTTQITQYDFSKDIEFLDAKGEYITLSKGEFVIFYPQDAHKPSINNGTPQTVKKVVVKVPINNN